MRILISLLLTLILYASVVFFFMLIFHKSKKQKEVLIHTAIIIPAKKKAVINKSVKKNINKEIKKKISKPEKKIVKKSVKKNGSKSAVTKGGENIKFNDIFKNVKYNVDTEKMKQKSQLNISRFKGVEQNLKNVKMLNSNISFVQNAGAFSKKEINNLLVKKLSPIWNEVSNIAGEYAKINIVFDDKTVKVYIIDSNLPETKQQELIEKIENVEFKKTFNITVKFVTKVNK